MKNWYDDQELEDIFGKEFYAGKRKIVNGGVYIETNPKAILQNTYPHYTDERFNEAKIIYLDDEKYHPDSKRLVKNYGFDYSDRLSQWNYQKKDESWEKVKKDFPKLQNSNKTAEFYERYLQYYFDDPQLKLHCIMSGVNVSNGYPYLVYGYEYTPKD